MSLIIIYDLFLLSLLCCIYSNFLPCKSIRSGHRRIFLPSLKVSSPLPHQGKSHSSTHLKKSRELET